MLIMKLIATREGIVFFVTIKNEAYSKDTCGKDRSITVCFFRKCSFFLLADRVFSSRWSSHPVKSDENAELMK